MDRPAEVKVGTIIRLFEGPLVAKPAEHAPEPDVLATLWQEAEDALSSVYDRVTLKDLQERERDLKLKNINDYNI